MRAPRDDGRKPHRPAKHVGEELDDWGVWGKSHGLDGTYPLICHLLDAAVAGGQIFDRVLVPEQRRIMAESFTDGSTDEARMLCTLLAGWHDIGKCSPGFQTMDEGAFAALSAQPFTAGIDPNPPRHDLAGYWDFIDWARGEGATGDLTALLGQVIGGHHGTFPEPVGRVNPGRTSHWLQGDLQHEGLRWSAARARIKELVADALYPTASWRSVLARMTGRRATQTARVAVLLLTGTVITADWLVSDTIDFIDVAAAPTGLAELEEWLISQESRIETRIAQSGISGPGLRSKPMAEQFPSIPGFEPRGVQRFVDGDLEHRGRGLTVIMDQTGGGKSEAGLHAASIMSGLSGAVGFVFALPTMATTDAMFDRSLAFCAAAFPSPTRLTLMHSLAYTKDSYTRTTRLPVALPGMPSVAARGPENTDAAPIVEVTDWLRGFKRGLLAPNTVCTIDQILAVAITSKWMALPFLGLTRRVVIIDEVHAYDPHMQVLFGRLVSWLAASGASVVAMSATLAQKSVESLVSSYLDGLETKPEEQPSEAMRTVSYPGWVHVSARTAQITQGAANAARPRTTTVVLVPYSAEDRDLPHRNLACRVAMILTRVLEGQPGNALVVCNTVRAAIETYRHLSGLAAPRGVEVEIFHARFPHRVRRAKASNLTNFYGKAGTGRPRASVVVATQVAEQSLDVDFDVVLSELAPAALLVQREGRGHRHVQDHRNPAFAVPSLHVLAEVAPDGTLIEKDQRPYDMADLTETWAALKRRTHGRERVDLAIPGDVQSLVDEVYDKARWEVTVRELNARMTAQARGQAGASVARMKAVPAPADLDEMWRMTRQGDADPDYATRYEMNAVAWLPVWRDGSGALLIGGPNGSSVPLGRPSQADMQNLMDETIGVSPSASWSAKLSEAADMLRPSAWENHPTAKRLMMTLMSSSGAGISTAQIGRTALRLDDETGLDIRYLKEGDTL